MLSLALGVLVGIDIACAAAVPIMELYALLVVASNKA